MAQGVGSLNVSVVANTGKARSEIKAFRSSLQQLAPTASLAIAGLSSVAGGIAAITAGVIFARRGIGDSMRGIDELAKSAHTLDIMPEKLAGIRLAAEENGLANAKLDKSLIKMTRSTYDASRGLGEAAEAYKMLALDARELNGLAPDEQFKAIAQAISELSNEQDQLAATTLIFGSRAAPLVNLLRQGAEGMDEAQAAAERLGIAIDKLSAEKIEKANDAWGRASYAVRGMFNDLTIFLAPAFERLAVDTQRAIAEVRQIPEIFGLVSSATIVASEATERKARAARQAALAATEQAEAERKLAADLQKDFESELATLKRMRDVSILGEDVVQRREDIRKYGKDRARQLEFERAAVAGIAEQREIQLGVEAKLLEAQRQLAAESQQMARLKEQERKKEVRDEARKVRMLKLEIAAILANRGANNAALDARTSEGFSALRSNVSGGGVSNKILVEAQKQNGWLQKVADGVTEMIRKLNPVEVLSLP